MYERERVEDSRKRQKQQAGEQARNLRDMDPQTEQEEIQQLAGSFPKLGNPYLNDLKLCAHDFSNRRTLRFFLKMIQHVCVPPPKAPSSPTLCFLFSVFGSPLLASDP